MNPEHIGDTEKISSNNSFKDLSEYPDFKEFRLEVERAKLLDTLKSRTSQFKKKVAGEFKRGAIMVAMAALMGTTAAAGSDSIMANVGEVQHNVGMERESSAGETFHTNILEGREESDIVLAERAGIQDMAPEEEPGRNVDNVDSLTEDDAYWGELTAVKASESDAAGVSGLDESTEGVKGTGISELVAGSDVEDNGENEEGDEEEIGEGVGDVIEDEGSDEESEDEEEEDDEDEEGEEDEEDEESEEDEEDEEEYDDEEEGDDEESEEEDSEEGEEGEEDEEGDEDSEAGEGEESGEGDEEDGGEYDGGEEEGSEEGDESEESDESEEGDDEGDESEEEDEDGEDLEEDF